MFVHVVWCSTYFQLYVCINISFDQPGNQTSGPERNHWKKQRILNRSEPDSFYWGLAPFHSCASSMWRGWKRPLRFGRGMIIYGNLNSDAMPKQPFWQLQVFYVSICHCFKCFFNLFFSTFKTFVLCEFELCIFNVVKDLLLVAERLLTTKFGWYWSPNQFWPPFDPPEPFMGSNGGLKVEKSRISWDAL